MITLTLELTDPAEKGQAALDTAWRALADAGYSVFRGKADGDDDVVLVSPGGIE